MNITRIMTQGTIRLTASFLAGFFLTTATLPSALAATATQSRYNSLDAESLIGKHDALRTELTRSLDDENVRAEMLRAGVKRTEIENRIAGMTDSELQQLKSGVQREAGGDTVIIGTTTLLLIIIIIILVADHSSQSAPAA